MFSQRLRRFLISGQTIQAHLLGLGLIVLLSVELWNGKGKADYVPALAFVVVTYPIVLVLLWLQERFRQRGAIQYVIDYHSAPEQLRRNRRGWRFGSFVCLLAFAELLIHFGYKGLRIDRLPAQYLGYFAFAVCVLGAAGVNIWYGGPLDPRFDPPPAPPGEEHNQ